jgi:3-hydroxymyristoyl/3-hydroxydecanoyl-(acyl carrier protein) dehydratase
MKTDREAIAELLDIPEENVKVDRYLYAEEFPNEIKVWKIISRDDPDLRRYEGESYYPVTSLFMLIDIATELLVKKRFPNIVGLPALVATDTRFRKPVRPETELLIQVKLLRNYKGKIGIFSGVIADREGDIVAENISKGTAMTIGERSPDLHIRKVTS